MTAVGIMARLMVFVLGQPFVQDFLADAGKRAVKGATKMVVSAIVNKRKIRAGMSSMK